MVSVEYRITNADGQPVDGLVLSVVPWMPDMGHGASIEPMVSAVGGGRYVISNVELFMPGRWELRTSITGPSEDRAAPPSRSRDAALGALGALGALALTLAAPAVARAQACCAGGTALSPGRLNLHESALVGLQVKMTGITGSSIPPAISWDRRRAPPRSIWSRTSSPPCGSSREGSSR